MTFEDLVRIGRQKRYLTYQDINRYLPEDASSDDMEELLERLEDLDIEVLDDGRSPLISPDDGL